jgi:hypothetical protein
MTKFSRKKIRGYARKLRQLVEWKNYIISYPNEDLAESSFHIFRIRLGPFYWYQNRNPHLKFHKHLYCSYLEILQKLNDNEILKKNKLSVQLWLYHPRTVKSLVIIAGKENLQDRVEIINALHTIERLPKLFNNYFDSFKLKISNDNVFKPLNKFDNNTEWLTIRLGDIWIVE